MVKLIFTQVALTYFLSFIRTNLINEFHSIFYSFSSNTHTYICVCINTMCFRKDRSLRIRVSNYCVYKFYATMFVILSEYFLDDA